MTGINEFQFELLPAIDAVDGEVFGIFCDVSLNDGGFHPGSTDWAVQDSESSSNGTTNFGRDKLLGPTWSWDLHVNRNNTKNAVASLSKFTAAWRALQIRDIPGQILPLRYSLGGRVRRVYGRPRRGEPSVNNLILSGYVDFIVDFKCFDGFTYDDVEQSFTLGLGGDEAPSGGGFTFPFTTPVAGAPATSEESVLVVGGDAPAYPRIRFNGPVTSPSLSTDEWTISLPDYVIPDGQYVEIDTRPWVSTVLRNGVLSVAGKVGRRQRITESSFPPGTLNASFGGSSSNGTATCQIWWANTWNSI